MTRAQAALVVGALYGLVVKYGEAREIGWADIEVGGTVFAHFTLEFVDEEVGLGLQRCKRAVSWLG